MTVVLCEARVLFDRKPRKLTTHETKTNSKRKELKDLREIMWKLRAARNT